MSVSQLFDRRLEAMLGLIADVDRNDWVEAASVLRLKKALSSEVLKEQSTQVISATKVALANNQDALQRFNKMVWDCKQRFELDGKVLSLVTIPVAVRLQSHMDGQGKASECEPTNLKGLEKSIARALNAENVVLHTKLFRGSTITAASGRTLMSLCSQLASGVKEPECGLNTHEVSSRTEAEWEMVYLVGVAVTDQATPLILNDERTQDRLMAQRYRAEWAISECDELLFNDTVEVQAKCHGMWIGFRGVEVGETLLRGYRLESMLRNLELGIGGVSFRYTWGQYRQEIRLLITTRLMSVEYRWPTLFSEDAMPVFEAELERIIDMLIPESDVLGRGMVEETEYDAMAKKVGVVWA